MLVSGPERNNQGDPGRGSSSIADLRAAVRAIERSGSKGTGARRAVPLGVPAIDDALTGGGLPRGCLHEIAAVDDSAAATGFSAVLSARLAGSEGTILWCRRERGIYAPGMVAFGLDTRRVLMVHPRSERGVLWAMEEALRCEALAAVLGEVAVAAPIALRRLHLAADAHGVTAVMLRPFGAPVPAGSAVTRWRVAAAPSGNATGLATARSGGAAARWRLELAHCRGGRPGAWLVDWWDETHRLCLAAGVRDRPARAPAEPVGCAPGVQSSLQRRHAV